MSYPEDVAKMGRPKYRDESGGRTETAMVWITPGERAAFKDAAALDEKTLSDWLRDLARSRAKRLGLRLPQPSSSD